MESTSQLLLVVSHIRYGTAEVIVCQHVPDCAQVVVSEVDRAVFSWGWDEYGQLGHGGWDIFGGNKNRSPRPIKDLQVDPRGGEREEKGGGFMERKMEEILAIFMCMESDLI